MGKNQDKKEQLDEELDQIKKIHNTSNMDQYMVNSEEDMPDFGEIKLYDYDSDLVESKKIGKKLLDDLVDLYLGDVPDIKNHPYIQSRMEEDADYYSQMKVIQKLSQELLLKQMKQIDGGDISPRMYEITSKHIGEIRENIKDGRTARLDIEKMYKEMRKDLGLNETVGGEVIPQDESVGGQIIDPSNLNNTIDDYLKNRESKD